MTTRTNQATTPTEIRDVFYDDLAAVSDVQLLVLLLGMGTTRHGRGRPKKTWTAIGLATDLMEHAGGRLEHLVESARSADFDRHRFGLGNMLGSRLIAAMELAHRWRRGLRRGGNAKVSLKTVRDWPKQVFERRSGLTEGDLLAIVLSRYPRNKELQPYLEVFSSPETLIKTMTPRAVMVNEKCRAVDRLGYLKIKLYDDPCRRLLATAELARRHRLRAGTESFTLKPGALGLESRYLIKLLDPASPLDRARRRSLIEQARSNPKMSADFATLDRLAKEVGTADYGWAIRHQVQFQALLDDREWHHPAEVLGEPLPYAALVSIAEARAARSGPTPARVAEVQELLEAAELAATEKSIDAFATALLDLEISDSGLERVLAEARRHLAGRRRRSTPEGEAG